MNLCHLDQAKRLTPALGAGPASSRWIQTPTCCNNNAALQISARAFAVLTPEGKEVKHKGMCEL